MYRLALPFAGPPLVLLFLAAAGCAGPPPPATPPPARPTRAPAAKAPAPTHAPGHIARADLDALLPRGLPWLLRETSPEDIVREGKFVGWRLVKVPEAWGTAHIKPGDVVTTINGRPLKTPDDAWGVWISLATASEVRIAYERNGVSGEVTLPIDGPPSKELAEKLASAPAAPPPTSAANPRQTPTPTPTPTGKPWQKKTVVIEEDPSLE
jgi:hypothetical protein